jgi:ABC-type Mn2+/Zn2+ transport system ATPase subunit
LPAAGGRKKPLHFPEKVLDNFVQQPDWESKLVAAILNNNPGDIVAMAHDVTVTFDGYLTRALARVNLEVRRGEILGLLGAEGAGKSTLLRLLAGRMRPTEGSVKVFGRSPRWGSARARIGYVPGKSEMARQRGFISRIFLGKSESAQAGARGVPGLTQAIMGARDLIVLDEPFAEAAPAEKAALKALIRELIGRGKTVIISSDSLVDTKDICERVAVLQEGKIQAVGSLQQLLEAPGALRFLAPVLPPEISGRFAEILRHELARESTPVKPVPASPERSEPEPGDAPSAGDYLTRLTKPTEGGQPAGQPPPQAASEIDHEKLEGLTKPAKPE